MLKLVEIIPTLGKIGGAERFFVDLCCCISRRKDIELSVILLYDFVDKTLLSKLDSYNIKFLTCSKKKGLDFSAAKKLKNHLLKISPDVIHTHNCCFFTYFLAFGYKKQKWTYFHTCHNVPEGEATKLEHFFRKRYSKKGLIINIGISKTITELFKKKYKVENIPTVLNGIELKMYNNIQNEKLYDFIVVARFNEEKNHRLLFHAFKEVLCKKNVNLLCLGGGVLFDESKDLVMNLGIEKNVYLPGPVNNVYDYLNKSKIFVLPSKYEGVPISILEAMNCGLPIIASNVGGVPEIVESGKNGILLEEITVSALKDAMLTLINDKEVYNSMSSKSLESVKNFSLEKTVDNYLTIFRKGKASEK